MDRKQWLTMLYREANLFLENHGEPGTVLTPEDLEELEPELDAQLREVLRTSGSLEDLIKHSVLREPPPELWREQEEWGGVLVSVAAACLRHDVGGILLKILAGELPRAPSGSIQDPA
jgi:hypothetical protein